MTQEFVGELTKQGHIVNHFSYSINSRLDYFQKYRFIRELRSLVNPIGLIKIAQIQLRHKPDIIWFQNINNYLSWSALMINVTRGRKFITLHDLTAISNFKSTPDSIAHLKSLSKYSYRRLRILLIRIFLKGVTVVTIGNSCREILVNFGFSVGAQINNAVQVCVHREISPKVTNSILFAGRTHQKGLELVSKAVSIYPEWKLTIAGDEAALKLALSICPANQVNYLGVLSRQELLKIIHTFEFVAVCSQYFDNYPTIGLEALAHGSIPITTSITGLADLLKTISEDLVIRPGQIPDLVSIKNTIVESKHGRVVATRKATDLKTTIEEYVKLFMN